MEVYGACVRLLIPRLQRLCARYLRAGIGPNTVLHALAAAHTRHLPAVKEYCLRFIVIESNYNTIVMSSEFETLEQSLMVEVIRRHQQPVPRCAPDPADEVSEGITIYDFTLFY